MTRRVVTYRFLARTSGGQPHWLQAGEILQDCVLKNNNKRASFWVATADGRAQLERDWKTLRDCSDLC